MLFSTEQNSLSIRVGARDSPLSRVQADEVLQELRVYHPHVCFEPIFLKTSGDIDLKTSLRTLGKTDFFTKEVDALQLEEKCRITIHSAKDLPDPSTEGLIMVALTRGIDSSDSLVLSAGQTLQSLPRNAKIATSSERREEAVRALRADLSFVDIRGTIGQRLEKLMCGEVNGVVIAEAALIRLKLTHLNRVRLPGDTVPLQGQLAILARRGDQEMASLFAPLDCRKKNVLYLGIDRKESSSSNIFHYPVIRLVARPLNSPSIQLMFSQLSTFTHLLFTSKGAVRIFCDFLKLSGLDNHSFASAQIIAIGQATARCLKAQNIRVDFIAQDETSEGVVSALSRLDLLNAYLLWPHSSQSRSLIADFLNAQNVRFFSCPLYDPVPQIPGPPPDLSLFDEIVFSSPSTVDAFLAIYRVIPWEKTITAQGSITGAHLELKKHNLL